MSLLRSGFESLIKVLMTETRGRPKGKHKMRQCLRCERLFKSYSIYNRLCERCSKEISDMPEDYGVGK